MGLLTIIIIAIGLAMDSFAVSIASGVILKKVKWNEGILIGFFMGGFQALMTFIGYMLGSSFKGYIEIWDHWIAFGLLLFLGGKMIIEGLKHESDRDFCPTKIAVLSLLALATSIDALAVGISFAFLLENVVPAAIIIGGITFAFSVAGVIIGARFSNFRKFRVEIIGGIILIGIGIKILIEHAVLHLA